MPNNKDMLDTLTRDGSVYRHWNCVSDDFYWGSYYKHPLISVY